MRFILSFILFTVFGFAQQNCHSEKVTGKPDTAKANTTATVAPTTAAAFPEEAPRISLADAKKDFDAGNVIFVDTRAETSDSQWQANTRLRRVARQIESTAAHKQNRQGGL